VRAEIVQREAAHLASEARGSHRGFLPGKPVAIILRPGKTPVGLRWRWYCTVPSGCIGTGQLGSWCAATAIMTVQRDAVLSCPVFKQTASMRWLLKKSEFL
jgi:hypothetical protein